MKLPHVPRPCDAYPFRKDSAEGWLGKERMTEFLEVGSFVCHKTINSSKDRKQCAGHMIIKGDQNEFVKTAKTLQIPLKLSGQELIFVTHQECIDHHA